MADSISHEARPAGPGVTADIARPWILANVVAVTVTAALALAGDGLRIMLGIGGADVTLAVSVAYVSAEIVMTAISMALFARLTGAVLAVPVPGFPHAKWMALHVTCGIAGGLLIGLSNLQPEADSEPLDWSDIPVLAFLLVAFGVGGVLLGAAWGGLQAMVLRQAAAGTRLWIASSAAAVCIIAILIILVLTVAPADQGWAAELIAAGMIVAGGTLAAVIMVPAARRLRPR